MEDKKTIAISSLIAMGLISLAMITPGFFNEPKYICESRTELGIQLCDDGFSKYVSDNGKCINSDAPNLICREGWTLITNDLIIDPPIRDVENVIGDDGIYREQIVVGVGG